MKSTLKLSWMSPGPGIGRAMHPRHSAELTWNLVEVEAFHHWWHLQGRGRGKAAWASTISWGDRTKADRLSSIPRWCRPINRYEWEVVFPKDSSLRSQYDTLGVYRWQAPQSNGSSAADLISWSFVCRGVWSLMQQRHRNRWCGRPYRRGYNVLPLNADLVVRRLQHPSTKHGDWTLLLLLWFSCIPPKHCIANLN